MTLISKTFSVEYPTCVLDVKHIDRLLYWCELYSCEYVSCYLLTLEGGGRWCFVLSEEKFPILNPTVWEYRNISKDNLKEYLFENGYTRRVL